MLQENIFTYTEHLLSSEKSFCSSDGKLLRSAVIEAAEKMSPDLLSALISNEKTKAAYFVAVNGTLVFDKVRFCRILQNKSFLPDSYTMYKNKIALVDSAGTFISAKNDVELVFPHKDCILEGGQTKEEKGRKEIFYNETLAPDQVTHLLNPKAFCNAKKYALGKNMVVEPVEATTITDTDNLIIKGNNLLALASLLERYAGKVKCIYIDPPYNTGNDEFNYNDNFNHSSWLVFMKNRLELAKKLLKDDGVIFVSLDDKENHYCKVLMDGIFGRENFIADICHKARGSISNDKIISPNHNHILFFAKNERLVFGKRDEYGIAKDLSTFTEKDDNGYYKLVPVDGPGGERKGNPHYEFLGITNYWRFSKERMQEMYNQGLIVKRGNSLQQKYYKSKASASRQTITTWWDEDFLTSSATKQLVDLMGGKTFDNPKNVNLILRALKMITKFDDNAIVLDFFSGSGTTGQAIMQLNSEDNGK